MQRHILNVVDDIILIKDNVNDSVWISNIINNIPKDIDIVYLGENKDIYIGCLLYTSFTEASLVKKLEENGIGRPSTYASIINSLTSRFYILIENKKIIPTDLGKNVNKFLVSNFETIINEKFTMEMEEKLDEIAENKKDWKKVISDFYAVFETFLKRSEGDSEDYKIKDEVLDEKCPQCGKNLVVKKTKFGRFIGCSGFPDCNLSLIHI